MKKSKIDEMLDAHFAQYPVTNHGKDSRVSFFKNYLLSVAAMKTYFKGDDLEKALADFKAKHEAELKMKCWTSQQICLALIAARDQIAEAALNIKLNTMDAKVEQLNAGSTTKAVRESVVS